MLDTPLYLQVPEVRVSIDGWFSSKSNDVTSIADLIKEISPLSAKCVPWFRGQRCFTWGVSAHIWRDYKPDKHDEERNLTNRFRARAGTRHQAAPRYEDVSTWLSLMQHYGLPTRLLDWTRSPLIAAYFALETCIYQEPVKDPSGKPNVMEDAAIWALNPHRLNYMESDGKENFTPSIDALMCQKMLYPAFTDNEDWKEPDRVMAVMAAEKDMRMFVQQGAFTIHSDPRPLEKRPGNHAYLKKLKIPKNFVESMVSGL